jgi:spore coat polysaccharide biosynthesis protein SpsF
MSNISAIIQARIGSTRLPGKVLMKLNEDTVLSLLLKQLKHSKFLTEKIIATTNNPKDDIIEKFAISNNIKLFRGDSDNVLDRYYQCAKNFSLTHIVRITADNPLIDPEIIDQAIKKYSTFNYDYLTNSIDRTFPNGTEVEIFSFDALEIAWKYAKKKSEREHVTPYFYNNPKKFKIHHFKQEKNQSKFRYTIDRKEDYALVVEILSRIKKRPLRTSDIIDLLTTNPQLLKLNSHIITNEGYIKSIKED